MLLAMADPPIDLVKQVPLFSDLNERELKQVAGSMKERTFRAGDHITEEGKGGVGQSTCDPSLWRQIVDKRGELLAAPGTEGTIDPPYERVERELSLS